MAVALGAALVALAGPARAQTDPPDPPPGPPPARPQLDGEPPPPGFPRRPTLPKPPPSTEAPPELEQDVDLEELEGWIALREEAVEPPPPVRASFAAIGWFDLRTRIRADRFGIEGSHLDALEADQGLPSGGASPWTEITIGRTIRGGFDFLQLARTGQFEHQASDVVFDGVRVARRGDVARASFEVLTTSGFVEWDPLYGRTYRFGLVGGARYFRLSGGLEGVRAADSPTTISVRRQGELLSPFFGGFVELTPFPSLTVATRIQFMNWSWSALGLRDARYLEFRLGGTINIVPGVLGIGAEFRYLVVRAEAKQEEGGRRLEAGLAASGAALVVTLSF
jgi:hypothetical protein